MKVWLLVLLLFSVSWADDKSAVVGAMKGWGQITYVGISADYAVVTWQQTEAGGQGLLRRVDGRWWVLSAGGGAFDAGYLWSLGVPETTIKALKLPMDASLAEAKKAGPRWTWLTRARDVNDQDLEGYSAFELTLARNEIFAVHGRAFKDPVLAGYFRSRAWYRPNPAYSDAVLTAREKRNSQFIMDYQKRKNLVF